MAKLMQIYNIDSFSAAHTAAKAMTSDAGIILARNLEHVSTEVFTQRYAGLSFLNLGIEVNNEGGYADTITKIKTKINGGFALGGGGDNSNGKIGLGGVSDSIPVLYKEGFSEWNENEIKQAEIEGRNLTTEYFNAHNELYHQNIDDLGFIGQSGKTTGLLNYSGFASGSATGAFSGLTAQQMYDEVATLITTQWASVLNDSVFSADRVVMPDGVYNRLNRTILNTAAGAMSVLKALEANFPTVVFGLTPKATSVGGSSRMVAFSSKRQAMQMRIPIPLEMSPIFQAGFKYRFDSLFRVAGLDVIENGAGRILTGV